MIELEIIVTSEQVSILLPTRAMHVRLEHESTLIDVPPALHLRTVLEIPLIVPGVLIMGLHNSIQLAHQHLELL